MDVKSGGFGWRLGDEGSGWWIAKEAIRRTLKYSEGRDIETKMTEDLIRFYGLENLKSFVTLLNSDTTEKGTIEKGSSLVLEYAEKGDPLAFSIIEEGADELCSLVECTYKRTGNKKLVLYGGVIENSERYRQLVIDKITSRLPEIEILPSPIRSSLEGALALAKDVKIST